MKNTLKITLWILFWLIDIFLPVIVIGPQFGGNANPIAVLAGNFIGSTRAKIYDPFQVMYYMFAGLLIENRNVYIFFWVFIITVINIYVLYSHLNEIGLDIRKGSIAFIISHNNIIMFLLVKFRALLTAIIKYIFKIDEEE